MKTDEHLANLPVLGAFQKISVSLCGAPRLIRGDMLGDGGEAELIGKLQRRDPNALAAAYDQYGQLVYSLFLRITHDQSASEDLVQELFLRVWGRAGDFDAHRGSLGVWIVSIARNMAIDHVRSAGVRFASKLQPLDNVGETQRRGSAPKPESIIDQARAVHAAFEHLSFNQKRVLELAYFEGFSQSEIAARLNEPLGTVKSWMRSAILRLRTVLKGGALE